MANVSVRDHTQLFNNIKLSYSVRDFLSLSFTCRWVGSCFSAVFLREVSCLVWHRVSVCQAGWIGLAGITTLCQYHVQIHRDVEVQHTLLSLTLKAPAFDFSVSAATCSVSVYQQGAGERCIHSHWFMP